MALSYYFCVIKDGRIDWETETPHQLSSAYVDDWDGKPSDFKGGRYVFLIWEDEACP